MISHIIIINAICEKKFHFIFGGRHGLSPLCGMIGAYSEFDGRMRKMDEDISCMTNAVPVATGTFKGQEGGDFG